MLREMTKMVTHGGAGESWHKEIWRMKGWCKIYRECWSTLLLLSCHCLRTCSRSQVWALPFISRLPSTMPAEISKMADRLTTLIKLLQMCINVLMLVLWLSDVLCTKCTNQGASEQQFVVEGWWALSVLWARFGQLPLLYHVPLSHSCRNA